MQNENDEGQETAPKSDDELIEATIDETLEASFPASDPPWWTLGTDHSGLQTEIPDDSDAQ